MSASVSSVPSEEDAEEEAAAQELEFLASEAHKRPMYLSGWEDDVEGVEGEEDPHKDPKTEILWAAENGKVDIVQKLLWVDSSLVSVRDGDGYSPLHRACYNNHSVVVDLLLSRGAEIDAKTADDWQPLHSAARWNSAKCVAKLLQHGADINARSHGGQTPLHLAASHSYAKETLQLLLWSPYLDSTVRNGSGETGCDIARRSGRNHGLFEMVEPCINSI